jgi:hypothetical protein
MSKPIDFASARKAQKDREYRSLVLKTFGDMEHADKRELLEHRAAVERANREKL